MLEPQLLTQRAFDEATATAGDRLIDAINQINEASLRLAHSTAAETSRSFERPEANPLNFPQEKTA